jgi:hypothetical protein
MASGWAMHTTMSDQNEAHHTVSLGPSRVHYGYLKMPQNLSLKSDKFQRLASEYGVNMFQDALADFIAHINNPGVSKATLCNRAHNTLIPFHTVPVFHKFKFKDSRNSNRLEVIDSVQVHPAQTDLRGQIIPARFDTVLVCEGQYTTHPNKGKTFHINEDSDLTDYYSGDQIAQVRVVFKIPDHVVDIVFPSVDITPPNHLTYVEWFTPLPVTCDPVNYMYKVSRMFQNSKWHTSIIPVTMILCSVHLFP